MRFLMPALALALLLTPSAVMAEWLQAETPHFIVHADVPAETLAGYARDLEAADSLMRAVTQTPPGRSADKLNIYMFDDVATLRGLMTMPEGMDAAYRFGRLGEFAVVARANRAYPSYNYRSALFHEYAHYFMMKHMSQVQPVWFTEGFASLFESAEISAGGTIKFGAAPPDRAAPFQALPWRPIGEVLTGTVDPDNYEGNALLYAEGWLLAHHLYFGGGRASELNAHLARIRAGQPIGDLDAAFGGGLAGLDSDIQAYWKRPFATREIAYTPLSDSDLRIQPMRPGEAAIIEPRIRLADVEGYESLDALYAAVLPLARKYPDDPAVIEYVAWLAYFANDYDSARQLIAPIMTGPSPSAHLLTLNGRLIIREALDGAQAEQFHPIIVRGRRYIEQALKLAPADPLVLDAMFDSYDAELTATPESAFDFLARAVAAAPADADLRFRYAEQMIKKRRFALAADILRPLANGPHLSREKMKALAYIAELEKLAARGR